MTTIDDAAVGLTVTDRRQPAQRARVSWASTRPFIPPQRADAGSLPQAGFDPVSSAERRRTRWARPMILRAVAGDALIAAVVMAWCMVSLPSDRPFVVPGTAAALLLWPALLAVTRGYDSRLVGQGPEEFQSVLRSAVLLVAAAGLTAYALQLLLPRRYLLVGVPLAAALTCVHRYVVRRGLHARRSRGEALLRTVVVGNPSAIDPVVRDLSSAVHHGYQVIGTCTPGTMLDVPTTDGVPVLGTLSDIPQTVVDHEVDVVIVAGAGLTDSSLRRLSWALERTGADLVVAPGLVEVAGPRLTVRPAAGLSLLHVDSPSSRSGRLIGKAVLDRVLGTAMFLFALPVIGVAAVLVALTSKGSPFFAQERIGKDGRSFAMWKLRSMVVDAERRRDHLIAHSDRDGLMFKMHSDPRVTSVGRWLRRLSLDELPQLWNVVSGSMSLVGPRPPLQEEYALYHDQVHRRLRVKPGLTGLWQVSGRADLTWEESIQLDLRYVDNWSLAMDLLIIWKTGRAVLRGAGAY